MTQQYIKGLIENMNNVVESMESTGYITDDLRSKIYQLKGYVEALEIIQPHEKTKEEGYKGLGDFE